MLGGYLDLVAAEKAPLVTHVPYRLDQLHRIEIKDILGLGWSPKRLMITGEAEDVVDAKGGGTEHIALQGNPVAVPDHHLQYRVKALQFQMDTGGQAAQPGYRGLVVGNVDGSRHDP
jgi:hypothetical protein